LSARDRTVGVAWFTAKEDQGQAFAAFSSDGGRTFGPPIRVDDEGSLGRVQIALLDDGAAVAGWVEFSEKKSQFKIRRIEPGGKRTPATVVADLSGIRIPRLVRVNDELLLSWTATEDGSSKVRTARVSLR
jgi:hypothetical protein